MTWPVRLSCTRCGRSEDRHPVPIPVVPEGRARLTVSTSCSCGAPFVWEIYFDGGYVRDVVAKEEQ